MSEPERIEATERIINGVRFYPAGIIYECYPEDAEEYDSPPIFEHFVHSGAGVLDGDDVGSIEHAAERLRRQFDDDAAEELEHAFIHALQRDALAPGGYDLVDDGTLDTVIRCPKCNGWLRFDGREAAIDFLENDRECWLCPEGDNDGTV